MIFEAKNLIIKLAQAKQDNIEMFYKLWNDPRVMTNVGFPEGLKLSHKTIKAILEKKNENCPMGSNLVAVLKESDVLIGECYLGTIDQDTKITETDVKLLPEFWGNGFGTEIKKGLVDYLFTHTDCVAVKATPNKKNTSSIQMQRKAGAKLTGEGIFPMNSGFPGVKTCPVEYFEYMIFRKDWKI